MRHIAASLHPLDRPTWQVDGDSRYRRTAPSNRLVTEWKAAAGRARWMRLWARFWPCRARVRVPV